MNTNTGKDVLLKVQGKEYKLSKFTYDMWKEFCQWAKQKLPDPFENFAERIKGLPEFLQKHAYDEASDAARRRGSLNDPALHDLLATVEGIQKCVALMFKKYQPHLTEAQTNDIFAAGMEEHGLEFFVKLFSEAQGAPPTDETEVTENFLKEKNVWKDAKKK